MNKYLLLALGLREFLKKRISLEQSEQFIRNRINSRKDHFLNVVNKGIFQNSRSPYLSLLKVAGCEYRDIESLVNKTGIEATLHKLRSSGVYISWEEFKAKKEVKRGNTSFLVQESDFDNPFLDEYYQVRSSGSRSNGTRTKFNFSHELDRAYYYPVMFAANNVLNSPFGLWMAELPSVAGIGPMLRSTITGKPVSKWFSPVAEKQTHASLRDRLATRYIVYGGRAFGAKLAVPEHVEMDQAVKVCRWLASMMQKYGSCSMECFTSPAVKLCKAAREYNIDISGVTLFLSGEPITDAKLEIFAESGVIIVSQYFITEVGFIGCGCSMAKNSDDVHLFHDSLALIQADRKIPYSDITVGAFYYSSILSTAPKILLNVESDDYGEMDNHSCGCLFEQLGFTTHLSNIRSFAKLTSGGMTIAGTDLVHILEKVLPREYGGFPTDYQLLEEEDDKGYTFLSLIISPAVGPLNDNAVIDTVIKELRKGNIQGGKLAAGFWTQMKTIRVKRQEPLSSFGKVATLHLTKK